jgi:GntR family transcriptional repressor for pyruvate dehydrogenase complex
MNIVSERAGDGPGQRRSLGEQVFDRMFRAIKSGAYSPDERLPTEHDLAAEFQVSRPIVREALRKLREQGLIYSRQGAGSFVRQLGIRQPLGFGQVENITGLHRCYEFRLMLEPAAAACAAERHRPETLATITAALAAMRDATARQRHREDADFAFHLAIARASENQYVAIAMEALESHIAVGMQFHGQSLKQTAGGLEGVYAEHAAIHDAIRDRDGAQASALMQRHLQGSRDRLFEGQR